MTTAPVLVVMGVSGSGKSTLGAALAADLDWEMVEGDELHPEENVRRMAAGLPLTDDDRAPWLNRIAAWIDARDGRPGVVTCSALKDAYRLVLTRPTVVFVFLDAPAEVLVERMRSRNGHFMPVSLLHSQLATLEVPHDASNVLRVDATVPTEQQVSFVREAIHAGPGHGVAALVLGAMYFGTRTDEATSFALLDRFVEAGGTTIDTADCYAFWVSGTGSGGQSEETLGRWLAARPGVRDTLTLATKVGAEPVAAAPGGVEGLSAAVVRRQADHSRLRLGVEKLDLYWAHLEDRSVPLGETVDALADLVDNGVVGRVGVSNHPTWRVEQARRYALASGRTPYTALQLSASYLRPRPFSRGNTDHRFGTATEETFDYLTAHPDLDFWAYSPLLQGAFTRTDRPIPAVFDHAGSAAQLAALRSVAEETGADPGQVVLAWMLGSRPAVRPIVGVSSVAQLDQALAAADLRLTPEQRSLLDGAGR